MPRKERPQKNPYCKRSKLTKKQFEDLAYYYFAEVIEEHSRDKIRYLFTMTSWLKEEERTQDPPTRQAISRNFDKISQYIWDNHVVDLAPALRDKDVFDELLDLLYEKKDIEKVSSSKRELYDYLGNIAFSSNENKIINSLMFYLLSSRSKAIKGFIKNKFYLEFSRIFFICAVIDANEIKLPSIYDANRLEYPFAKLRKINNFEQFKYNFGWSKNNAEFCKIEAEWRASKAERDKIMSYSKLFLLSFLKEKPM